MTQAQFSASERAALLQLKGVGPTVVARFEQMGYVSLEQLATANADELLSGGAELTGSSCWKNSPQARKAVEAAINCAKSWDSESQGATHDEP